MIDTLIGAATGLQHGPAFETATQHGIPELLSLLDQILRAYQALVGISLLDALPYEE